MNKEQMKQETNNGGLSSSPSSKRESSMTPPSLTVEDCVFVSEVTLEYLRHVIFKFLTSTELDKQKQMTRAVATLLQFSAEEERKLQDYLDWKMSWFGSKPI